MVKQRVRFGGVTGSTRASRRGTAHVTLRMCWRCATIVASDVWRLDVARMLNRRCWLHSIAGYRRPIYLGRLKQQPQNFISYGSTPGCRRLGVFELWSVKSIHRNVDLIRMSGESQARDESPNQKKKCCCGKCKIYALLSIHYGQVIAIGLLLFYERDFARVEPFATNFDFQLGGNIFDVGIANFVYMVLFTSAAIWVGCVRKFSLNTELRKLRKHRGEVRKRYAQAHAVGQTRKFRRRLLARFFPLRITSWFRCRIAAVIICLFMLVIYVGVKSAARMVQVGKRGSSSRLIAFTIVSTLALSVS